VDNVNSTAESGAAPRYEVRAAGPANAGKKDRRQADDAGLVMGSEVRLRGATRPFFHFIWFHGRNPRQGRQRSPVRFAHLRVPAAVFDIPASRRIQRSGRFGRRRLRVAASVFGSGVCLGMARRTSRHASADAALRALFPLSTSSSFDRDSRTKLASLCSLEAAT